jgi:hypothetical protein
VAVPETETRSLGQRLVDLLNEHIKVTETDIDGECILYIGAEFRNKGEEAMSEFLEQMMNFVNQVAPIGQECYVSETNGFELRETEPDPQA